MKGLFYIGIFRTVICNACHEELCFAAPFVTGQRSMIQVSLPSCSANILAQSLSSLRFRFAEIHPFDLLNLMVHALLALLMLGDLVIVGHPVRMDPGMREK